MDHVIWDFRIDTFLESIKLELFREELKKVGYPWIIAVAVHDFIFEELTVMLDFVLNVFRLSIKLVVFTLLCHS